MAVYCLGPDLRVDCKALTDFFELQQGGITMAAKMPKMTTTIRISTNVNPFLAFMLISPVVCT